MKMLKMTRIFLCLCIVPLIQMPALYAEEEISIKASPNIIQAFAASKGDWVTVHTDIPYSSVAVASVTMNGLDVDFTESDSCGDLVAKISLTKLLERVLVPGRNELHLEGLTRDKVEFFGTDTIHYIIKESGKR